MGVLRLMPGSGVAVGAPGICLGVEPLVTAPPVWVLHVLTTTPTRMTRLRQTGRHDARIGLPMYYTGRMLVTGISHPSTLADQVATRRSLGLNSSGMVDTGSGGDAAHGGDLWVHVPTGSENN